MSQVQHRILLVDDEPNLRKVLGALLKQLGFEVHAENDGAAALARVRAAPPGTFDVVITDLRMPNLDGMGLLKALQVHEPGLPVILLTAHGSIDSAVEAVKLGAFDYLEKPFDKDQIHQIVQKAITTRERSGPSIQPSPPPGEIADPCAAAGMVGRSPSMQAIREIVGTVAASPSTVLIAGESGTGKELVARALHLGSSRRSQPFIKVNCAAIPGGLVESELFGHERGAFTGAVSSRAGRFELADGGTLFLDEVSEIPKEIQVKLLRAIQESEFERVGGVKTLHVNVRLIAATNRNLEELIREGQFREDLYYRLNVVPIHLPALRERLEDLPFLVSHFVQRCNERLGKTVQGLTPAALAALERYPWPGNIRELENLMERMVLFASGPLIDEDDLPDAYAGEAGASAPSAAESSTRLSEPGDRQIRLPLSSLGQDLKEAVKAGSRLVEEALIREALAKTDGNVTRSARALGISRRSLQSKMKELGLRESPDEGGPKGPPPQPAS
ncbi:sigma-54 dependent transcriptional regulator [Nannocystis sp. SCPEA4]|uniref:sigma-54-dependent transcriptional regulator n=1 Tax=Nannocystis sp. SCPEA4 TaxID=2996787 RepID=UPI00226FB828|nr:sigma-54 dependent transcriptional regulator [Nannocystis sp. SCPEA4]MCY1056052.1 sigma-54 dependent transcriptional regulator [Nannocystis sp. SCPEA4]